MKVSLQLDKDFLILKEKGYTKIVGIDEVGRGSWAGPVAVGAYCVDLNTQWINGINDSKQVSLKNREKLVDTLSAHIHSIHLGSVENINKYGIGKSITFLIQEIVEKYNNSDTFFLIDGQFSQDFGTNSLKVIKGDATYYSIAAASILAKVYRDNLMKELHKTYPHYGFLTNVGYPSKSHIQALKIHGPTPIHRTSFTPIGEMLINS